MDVHPRQSPSAIKNPNPLSLNAFLQTALKIPFERRVLMAGALGNAVPLKNATTRFVRKGRARSLSPRQISSLDSPTISDAHRRLTE